MSPLIAHPSSFLPMIALLHATQRSAHTHTHTHTPAHTRGTWSATASWALGTGQHTAKLKWESSKKSSNQ
uniref:Putative secreted protein n=1 Tax=Anopheles darlingi TaxID=43151 RepID=A0A2M4DQ81_ANODA